VIFITAKFLDNPREYVLVEAFRDQEAGVTHVTSAALQEGAADPAAGTWRRRRGSST
jgi:quinol monooxygenase YgiN